MWQNAERGLWLAAARDLSQVLVSFARSQAGALHELDRLGRHRPLDLILLEESDELLVGGDGPIDSLLNL